MGLKAELCPDPLCQLPQQAISLHAWTVEYLDPPTVPCAKTTLLLLMSCRFGTEAAFKQLMSCMLKHRLVSPIEIRERAVTYLGLSNLLATDTIASFPRLATVPASALKQMLWLFKNKIQVVVFFFTPNNIFKRKLWDVDYTCITSVLTLKEH